MACEDRIHHLIPPSPPLTPRWMDKCLASIALHRISFSRVDSGLQPMSDAAHVPSPPCLFSLCFLFDVGRGFFVYRGGVVRVYEFKANTAGCG